MSAILIDGKLVSAKLRGEVTEKRIEFEKNRKKFLTNSGRYANIQKLSDERPPGPEDYDHN